MIYSLNLTNENFVTELQKTLCWPIDLYDVEIILEIDYEVRGKYYPATFFEPEEFPELELTHIYNIFIVLESRDVALHDYQIKLLQDRIFEVFGDEIEAQCWEDLENKESEFYGDDDDLLYPL